MGHREDESLSEIDEFALHMENEVDRFVGNRDANRSFVQVRFAADSTVGDYPQAALARRNVYLEDDGSPYRDRFPTSLREPIQLKLEPAAKWTDVLSSDLWSAGFLLCDRALALFERFPLGNTRPYRAEVQGGRERRIYTYLFTANHVTHDDVDFARSEFYIADMIGSPLRAIEIASADDYDRKREQINRGEFEGVKRFSGLRFKSMHLRPSSILEVAIFGLGTFGTQMFVSRELCDALREAEVTGLEFKPNNMLFTD